MKTIVKIVRTLNSQLDRYPIIAYLIFKILPSNRMLFGKMYRDYRDRINFNAKPNLKMLFDIVNFSIEKVPFYKKSYTKLSYGDLNEFENKIGFLNRDDLFSKNESLLSSDFQKDKYEIVTTGGTSGKPAKFYLKKDRYKKEYAFFHKVWATKGYNDQIRGVIRNERLDKNINYKISPITREIIFDAFRNTEEYCKVIYKTLVEYKVYYLQCYPSSAFFFATIAQKQNLDLSFLKGVFLSSENYLYHQKVLFQKLKLPVVSVYGHSEKLALAVDFHGDGKYKVINDYGYLELIDKDGDVIKEVDVIGEIVTTTLDNYGQPLLRYRTGDYSSYYKYEEDKASILNNIEGRWEEMKIYNNDNTYVTPTALNLHNDLYIHIEGLQYYQRAKGHLEVRIIPHQSYNDIVENRLINHYKSRLHHSSTVEIKIVNKLSRNANGKFLLLISEIK